MKKLLFSILIVLGLFLVGCGKDNKEGETEVSNTDDNKGRIIFVIQDKKVFSLDPKEQDPVKQIEPFYPDGEDTFLLEQDKLFEKALKSKEDFIKYFPNLREKVKKLVTENFEDIKNEFIQSGRNRFLINYENSFYDFIKNNKELKEYIPEEKIKEIISEEEEKSQDNDISTTEIMVVRINEYIANKLRGKI